MSLCCNVLKLILYKINDVTNQIVNKMNRFQCFSQKRKDDLLRK